MARLNVVRLYGCVADEPKITKKNDGSTYVRGMCHLATIRSTRYSGETFGEKDRILYDWPIILTTDQEMIAKMDKFRQYDMVEIRGVFVVRKIRKQMYCKSCGALNKVEGNLSFVLPIFMERRNTAKEVLTEKQAVQEVIKNRMISNSILISGNLCNDVNYYHQKNIETAVYQIATDRRYFIRDDNPETRTDFPVVRSYGKNARQDNLCLHTGSLVTVDGFLHTRQFERKTICEACNTEFVWNDNTIEIVPYATDYMANYTDPETAEEERKQRLADEGDRLMETVLKN
ncbi:MAG: single-stranded DNA-binding protein [Clostridiales bacterium]|nr:single-stranded DNA-binding protein [Clostridiales bacterium]